MRRESLSSDEARRTILAAQGFGGPNHAARAAIGSHRQAGADRGPLGDDPTGRRPGRRLLLATVRRLGLLQVDSVNVLARAHYLPLFSRLGGYDRAALDLAAARRPRALFEYWGHEASLLPVETQPLLRWRMAQDHPWGGVARAMRTRTDLIGPILAAIRDFGPVTATQLEAHLEHDEPRPTADWGWNWTVVKQLVEGLFFDGAISSAGRDNGFRRRYDLTERVLPPSVLRAPTPERSDAVVGLVAIASRALGVATMADLRDYFRLPAAHARAAVAALAESGELQPVMVPGWPPAWRHRDARVPRHMGARALLVPFDPLIWHRERVERVFGMHYRIEIYTPAPKRQFGYYVLPFLQGDRLAARVDLRADRKAGRLVVAGAWEHTAGASGGGSGPSTEHADPDVLVGELARLADWLGLVSVTVEPNGDLSDALAASARTL